MASGVKSIKSLTLVRLAPPHAPLWLGRYKIELIPSRFFQALSLCLPTADLALSHLICRVWLRLLKVGSTIGPVLFEFVQNLPADCPVGFNEQLKRLVLYDGEDDMRHY